jgi:hypothetical protein
LLAEEVIGTCKNGTWLPKYGWEQSPYGQEPSSQVGKLYGRSGQSRPMFEPMHMGMTANNYFFASVAAVCKESGGREFVREQAVTLQSGNGTKRLGKRVEKWAEEGSKKWVKTPSFKLNGAPFLCSYSLDLSSAARQAKETLRKAMFIFAPIANKLNPTEGSEKEKKRRLRLILCVLLTFYVYLRWVDRVVAVQSWTVGELEEIRKWRLQGARVFRLLETFVADLVRLLYTLPWFDSFKGIG